MQQGILFDDSTDHLPIFQITCLNNAPCKKENPEYFYRNITQQTILSFQRDLADVNWSNVYSTCSLILPYLTYCNIVWGNTFRTYTNKLLMLQKKAIWLISKAHFIAHTDPLFKDLKLLNLDNINKYQQNVFMYKYANKQLPSKFQALFTFSYNGHNYNTRTSTNIHLPTHRTRLFQHTIRYTGAKNGNTLPQLIRHSPSLGLFKRNIKRYLLNCSL